MPDCRLTHAVTDRKGNPLLAAGTRLTPQILQTLTSGQTASIQRCRLLDFRQVRSDMLTFFTAPPYDVIFQDAERKQALFDIAGAGRRILVRQPAFALGLRCRGSRQHAGHQRDRNRADGQFRSDSRGTCQHDFLHHW